MDPVWLQRLLSWLDRRPEARVLTDRLVEPATLQAHARSFKMDVSVDLSDLQRIRWSLNDTGEPEAFRARLRALWSELADPAWLERFLAISPPGGAQTTASFKWEADGSGPSRLGLYFEELHLDPQAARIHGQVARLAMGSVPGPLQLPLAAVCMDLRAGEPAGFKDYWLALDHLPAEAGPHLQALWSRLPTHPRTGERRGLYVRRFDRRGRAAGERLLWVTECTRTEDIPRTWACLDDLGGTHWGKRLHGWPELRRWIEGWPTDPGTFLYPDLVAFNVDPGGEPAGVQVYLSLK